LFLKLFGYVIGDIMSNEWENIVLNKKTQVDSDIEMLQKGLNNLSDELLELTKRVVSLENQVRQLAKWVNSVTRSG